MNGFQPFMSPQQFQPYQNYPQYQIPQQQVLQANGKASIDALKLAPNSSVLIMDTTAPIVWMCVSDSLGNVTPTPYDIFPHKEKPHPDMESLEQRLSSAEQSISKLLEAMNHESDAAGA